jgi:hypothetical protein
VGESWRRKKLRDLLKQQPFEPFRLVMSDGVGYDIRYPDLLWVGLASAYMGLTGQASQSLFE